MKKSRAVVRISAHDLIENPVLAALTNAERGVLLTLMARIQLSVDESTLPDDDSLISRLVDLELDVWRSLKARLLSDDCGVFWAVDGRFGCRWISKPPPATAIQTAPQTIADAAAPYPMAEWVDRFEDTFWPAVWSKKDKPLVLRNWKRLKPATRADAVELLGRIMAGVELYKLFLERNPSTLVKYPQGWLTARRWENEYTDAEMRGESAVQRAAEPAKSAAERMQERALAMAGEGNPRSGRTFDAESEDCGRDLVLPFAQARF